MADNRSYWLDLFSWGTWNEFLKSGANVSGFRVGRRKSVEQMRVGDYLLCYLTGISRYIGILEVTSDHFIDEAPIWKTEAFPARVGVRIVAQLDAETAVPVVDLLPQFSWFATLKAPESWTGYFRGSPGKMTASDGEMVAAAILKAVGSPTRVSFDPKKLKRPEYKTRVRAPAVEPAAAAVSEEVADFAAPSAAPESLAPIEPSSPDIIAVSPDQEPEDVAKKAPAHKEMQWLLSKLGNDLGLTVWLPPNDRGFEYGGHQFTDLNLGELPLMFTNRALRTVRQIDVIWLGDGSIEAAFEIESTTSIYSGILRLADLIALVPGITIPLFIVAPDDRRKKVYSEVTRPTFGRLSPPMAKVCRYIPFSVLREKLPAPEMRAYTSPQFIRTLSEECLPEPG
jgi:hypothetical protein